MTRNRHQTKVLVLEVEGPHRSPTQVSAAAAHDMRGVAGSRPPFWSALVDVVRSASLLCGGRRTGHHQGHGA